MTDLKMPKLPEGYRFTVEEYHGPSDLETGMVHLEQHKGEQYYKRVWVPDPRESKNSFLRSLGYTFRIYKGQSVNKYRPFWYSINQRVIENTDEGIVKGAEELALWLERQTKFESRVGTYPPKELT